MVWMILILIFVIYALGRAIYNFVSENNAFSREISPQHAAVLEVVWTLIPSIILIGIAVPTFSLLYSIDEVVDSSINIKVIGYQWYWQYEYPRVNFKNLTDSLAYCVRDYGQFKLPNLVSASIDSYMIPEDNLKKGALRLLEVDNRLVVPIKCHIRMLVTSGDVLHSWAVPSLGVKMDACPVD